MKITKVLETIGLEPQLRHSATIDCEKLLTEMSIPTAVTIALISNDRYALEQLAGFKRDIICFIATPAKERDMPKDDNKPPKGDEPLKEEALLARVG